MAWRATLLNTLFESSYKFYAQHFKGHKTPWGLTAKDLLEHPPGSLGHRVGQYLRDNGFELLPKLENHDIFHVVTQTPTDVKSEIGLQYLLWGNGKSSLYMWGVLLLGAAVLPEHLPYFLRQRARGAGLESFHKTDFQPLLKQPLEWAQPVPKRLAATHSAAQCEPAR